MNCKQGDLAIIVRSYAGNEGKIIRCIRLHDSETRDLDGGRVVPNGPRWVMDQVLPGTRGRMYTIADAQLRPIRYDAEDELCERSLQGTLR